MESWKVIPCSFFKKYGGLNFLLHCNFDEKFLQSIVMPSFYKQILSFFLELKSSYDTNGDQELILFNNKEIQIGGKPVFYQDWFDHRIYSICHILDSNGILQIFVGNFQLSPIFSPIFKFCRLFLNDCGKRRGTLLAPIQFLLQGIPLFTCHRRC